MFSLEERSRAVELYLTTPMTTAQVVECLGYPTRQCLERWLAMDPRYAGRMAKPIIPPGTRRKAIELVLGGMQQKQTAKQLGVSVGAVHNWVRAYRRGGMAALQPRNQNAAQGGKSASVRPRGGADAGGGDDVEALRRRVEELESGERVDAGGGGGRRKRPGRRPAAPVEPGEDDAGRPAGAEVFAEVDGLLAAHSAEQPRTATMPGSASASTPGCAPAWRGRSPTPRAGTGTVASRPRSGRASRRTRSAGSWPRAGSRRMFPNGGVTAPTRGRPRPLPVISPTGTSPPNGPMRSGSRTPRGIKASDGKVYLSPMIDCHDGKIVAYTAGFHPNAELANRMLAEAAETLPDNARPVVHSDRGCHYRWPGWLELMERYGLIRSMSAKGCSPDNAAAEGFFGRMKTESVYPEHWEKRTRDEVLVLIDEYIHWYNAHVR